MKLKRCPCGGQAELKSVPGRRFGEYVRCKKCGASTIFTRGEGAAVGLWNSQKGILPGTPK